MGMPSTAAPGLPSNDDLAMTALRKMDVVSASLSALVRIGQQGTLFDVRPAEKATPRKIGQATIQYIDARSILTKPRGFLDQYDYTLNPYSGCSFGCTYCYAAFFSRTPEEQEQWGYWVKVKQNAVGQLKRRSAQLRGRRIYMSSVTDPYQPIERQLELTRQLLEVLISYPPVLVVQTRSPDVTRDIDVYQKIEAGGGRVQVNMTVTTDDEDIRRTFEPYCPDNARRLKAIGVIRKAGIETCITLTPLLLVKDASRFADSLLETGVRKFVLDPFHFRKGRFVAGTRDAARRLMAEKLACNVAEFQQQYEHHYCTVRDVLRSRLPDVGEGKNGFAPPI